MPWCVLRRSQYKETEQAIIDHISIVRRQTCFAFADIAQNLPDGTTAETMVKGTGAEPRITKRQNFERCFVPKCLLNYQLYLLSEQ
jgi:hypothetical protein